MEPAPPKVSLIVPFYNDQDRLLQRMGAARDFLQAQPYSSELILVDDGSMTDRSEEIRQAFPGVQLIRYSPNCGKGYAVRTGMLAAKGEYRFFTDADLPFGMEPLRLGLDYLERKDFDLVIGDRQAPGSVYHVEQSPMRRLASKVFTSFISRLVITGVKDTQCGFKGFKAPAAELIFRRSRVNRFAFDVEIVYISFKHNLDLKRIPVKLEHSAGSTLKLHLDSIQMLAEVFRIKWNHLKGYYD
ncbi:MAG TPA: glycosyltransferase [bacterium]|nr:glycosyltransferase [bacterium]